ncbi:MAG: hypothetical protein EP340_03875 [Alphaproteobacteria bacterium]|nr:MAG: hypothetical protein EP340_03875 [Alphaproteobacteria bacterium]
MSFAQEIRAGLKGALRLFFWDKNAFEEFDISADGFWRSFAAPIMILPFYYLFFAMHYNLTVDLGLLQRLQTGADLVSERSYVWHWVVAYVLDIVILPILLVPISRLLQFNDRYVHMVIARNWGQALAFVLYFVPILMYGLGLLSPLMAGSVFTLMVIVGLIYELAIIRFASGLNVFISAIILIILGLINEVIKVLVDLL